MLDSSSAGLNSAILIRDWHSEGDGGITIELTTSKPAVNIDQHEYELLSTYANNSQKSKSPDNSSNRLDEEAYEHLAELQAIIPNPDPATCGYHEATRDHPFLDMTKVNESRRIDNELMAAYYATDDYPSVYLDLPGTSRHPLEHYSDLELAQLWSDPKQMLSLMISGTFGKRRHLAGYHDPYWDFHQLELLFKPIPSGGARHPTEAFFNVETSRWLSSGVYHFNVKSNELVKISSEVIPNLLPDIQRVPTATHHIVVLFASLVRRAMFRYRDPRSFRALLVDVGHADTHLGALAAYCNWSYESQILVDIDNVPAQLGMPNELMPILLGGLLQGWC